MSDTAYTHVNNTEELDSISSLDNLSSLNYIVKVSGNHKVLSREEERYYLQKYRDGDKSAREYLITSNIRLVISVVKKHYSKNYAMNKGLPPEDLIQEGILGLMHAIDRFEMGKDTKLSTYAYFWIQQYIQRAIDDDGTTIRIPVYIKEQQRHMLAAIAQYQDEHNGKNPTDAYLAKALGLTESHIQRLRKTPVSDVSLDMRIGWEEEGGELINFVTAMGSNDSYIESPEEQYEKTERIEIARELVNCLDERSKSIMIMRYGLFGGKPHTLEECGVANGVTRERVRQIEKKALQKLAICAKKRKFAC